jgi:DNA-binding CsgD family transcriptional regulator
MGEPTSVMLLTRRETQVLQLAADGQTRKEVALVLGVSLHTVKTQGNMAREKLGASNTSHAVAIALRQGLID